MLDIQLFRNTPDAVRDDLKKRGRHDDLILVDQVVEKDAQWRALKREVEDLRHKRNNIAKEVAQRKKDGKDADDLFVRSKELASNGAQKEKEIVRLQHDLNDLLMKFPNLLHNDVPRGKDEEGNVVVAEHGTKPQFTFKPKSHVDLMVQHDWADIDRAGKIAGSRFYFLKGELLLLEKALMSYGLDFMAKRSFTLVEPPFMMNRAAYEGVTDLQDFEEVMYKIEDEDLYLIATSEHPLTAMYMNEILEPEVLPISLAGISPCFRKEAGTHGKDTKGIFRVHHFNKVEQVVICRPENSWQMHEALRKNAEDFWNSLEIPYRTMNMCTGDIGIVAAKKYDLEAWCPVQQTYREVGSCSNCTDYQARRLRMRMRGKERNVIVHTLNATCVATSRALVTIMENFQDKDGSVHIPEVLQKYMGGKTIIGKA